MRLSCDCQNICNCHAIVKTFICIIDLLWTYALDKNTERLLYNNVVCSTNSIRLKAFFYKSTFASQIFYAVVPKKWFPPLARSLSLFQPHLPPLFFLSLSLKNVKKKIEKGKKKVFLSRHSVCHKRYSKPCRQSTPEYNINTFVTTLWRDKKKGQK